MHITLESDYAIRIVHCLCKNGKRMDARTISESTGVTLRFSLKILRKLVSSKIIRSFKGSQGGYEITKNPGEISLREVIEVVEGLGIRRKRGNGASCAVSPLHIFTVSWVDRAWVHRSDP